MNSLKRIFPLEWQVGWTDLEDGAPERWVSASVPGAVQLDWARAESWPPFWQGENFRAYRWMEDKYWIYKALLKRPDLPVGCRLVLKCGGVDYACEVRAGGKTLFTHVGMFSPFSVDLTDVRDGVWLEIRVRPAPKEIVDPNEGDILELGRKESRQSCKPAVSYGWDFHPRLIPLGIWEETFLEVLPVASHLDHAEVVYELASDYSEATLRLTTEGSARRVRWTIDDPSGKRLHRAEGHPESLVLKLEAPALWWPLSEGGQPLYTSTVEVLESDGATVQTISQRVGIRRIRLVMAPGQFSRAGGCPATQPPVPMTFEVNGRSIFARGANWVCPEIFPGLLTRERYQEQLSLFANAHLNLLRSWGGAVVNKTVFFELCDELGIMVWQEFPLACNRYEGSATYLKILDQESRAIIRRLRRHASLALWCGGNELFNAWSGMTPHDHALRMLGHHCFELDPVRPFLPTSPLVGVRHGDYRFKMGREKDSPTVFDVYPAHDATAYMEFGVPGPSSAAELRKMLPEGEAWPLRETSAWIAHHAYGSWHAGEPGSWLYPEVAEHYFGPSESLEQLVERLQLLQAEGYKAIYEEGRRQKPICSAVACWVFNEPWPTAANNSLIAWPNTPKPAYQAVVASNRPVMLSARIPRFDWVRGEEFAVTLFLLNDAPVSLGARVVSVVLMTEAGQRTLIGSWICPGAEAGAHTAGPKVSGLVPDGIGETFKLLLEATDHPELDSLYTLCLKR